MDRHTAHAFLGELARIHAPDMEKEARSYLRDFMGGVDPTGGATFQYGMRDVEEGRQGASGRRMVGAAGGLLGGAVAVPAGVGGLIGAVKGFGRGSGVRGRLVSAGRGFASGAVQPFRKVYRAARAKGALKAVEQGKKMTGSQQKALHTFATKELPVGALGKHVSADQVGRMASSLTPEMAAKAREAVGSRLSTGLATLGTSGAIGAGSAYLQYGKGQAAAQRYQHPASAPAVKTAGLVGYLARKAVEKPVRTVVLARGAKDRHEKGKRRHREMMRALDPSNPYPAGWVALGMKPRS